jgi:hypothetical protein
MSDTEERGGLPRWAFPTILAVAIVAVLVAVMLTLGGGHRIPQHGQPTTTSSHRPPQH